jgi:PhzF family phenazine biosynthesis protein
MSLSLPFHQVDVFTSVAYKGNPVAVVVAFKDPSITLTDEQMASFANWTNLSETTFILPPSDPSSKADYRLRIFTTQYELPFAGHPTIGSCEAFLAAGGVPKVAGKVVQECGLGLISLQVDSSNDSIYFAAPPLSRSGDIDAKTRETACKAMHIDPKSVASAVWIDNGPPWFALELKDAQAVLDVNVKAVSGNDDHGDGVDFMWGIWGTYEQGKGPNGASVEVRTFFDRGQNEDPVTGSFA